MNTVRWSHPDVIFTLEEKENMFLQWEKAAQCSRKRLDGAAGGGARCLLCFLSPPLETTLGLAARHSLQPMEKSRNQSNSSFEPLLVTAVALKTLERLSQSRKSFLAGAVTPIVPSPGLLAMLSEYLSHARVHGSPGEPSAAHLFSLNTLPAP